MSDEIAFNSKIDLWLLIVLLTAVALCLWIVAESWNGILARGWLFGALVAVPLVIGIVLPLWLIVSLKYFLSDRQLRVRCGPFTWCVPIAEITAVAPTNNLLSSPAMSLDRLKIEYGQGKAVMISPEPREEFLRQLEFRRRQAA